MEIRGDNAIICLPICFEGKEGAGRRRGSFLRGVGGVGGRRLSSGDSEEKTDVMNTE